MEEAQEAILHFVESKSVYEKHFKFNGRREKWGVTGVGEDVLPVYFLNGKKKKAILKVKKKTQITYRVLLKVVQIF
jgi:hypothetical protein